MISGVPMLFGGASAITGVAALFANGEQGVWFDLSDMSTLFQDSAGTIPVTAVGQAVGKMLDKSGNNNHATQSNSTKRPIFNYARYNLLTKTEQLDDAAWSKGNVTVTANAATAPDGTTTAEQIAFPLVTATMYRASTFHASVVAGTSYTMTIRMRSVSGTFKLKIAATDTTTWATATVSPELTLTTDWAVYTLVFTTHGSQTKADFVIGAESKTPYSMPATGSIYAWGASIVQTVHASKSYQRVNTSTDYAQVDALSVLSFDGSDDYMETGSINFTATNKLTAVIGAAKLRDGINMLVELGIGDNLQQGVFNIVANGSSYSPQLRSNAAGPYGLTPASYPGAQSVTAIGVRYDIAQTTPATEQLMRVNGVQQTLTFTGSDSGTGNFGTYPLYIGFRFTAPSYPALMAMQGLIVRGAASTDAEMTTAENYVLGI